MPAALDPDRALVAGRGVVLLGEKDADPPTLAAINAFVADPTTFPAGFAPFGDTSAEDLPEFEQEGGETEMLHTWWVPNARAISADPATRSYTVNALQFDNDTMALYEGGGDYTEPNIFWTPKQPVPRSASALVILVDTSIGQTGAMFNPAVSIKGGEGIALDRENFAQIPLVFTETNSAQSKGPRAWIGEHFGTPA